jgi:flagellar hook-length control protein FliK
MQPQVNAGAQQPAAQMPQPEQTARIMQPQVNAGAQQSAVQMLQPEQTARAVQPQVNAVTKEQMQPQVNARGQQSAAQMPQGILRSQMDGQQAPIIQSEFAQQRVMVEPIAVHSVQTLNHEQRYPASETPAAGNVQLQDSDGVLNGATISVEAQDRGSSQQQFSQQQSSQQGWLQQEAMPADDAKEGQLPGEAAFDKAQPQTELPMPQQAGVQNASNASFQQVMQTADADNVAQAAHQPRTDYDVPQQIVDQARLIRTMEDTQMVIKLKPEHLGNLTLKITMTANGSVNASFHSDNAQVRGIIENSMVQLKQELQAQGIKVDHVEVYAGLGDGSLLDQGAQQGQYGQKNQAAKNQRMEFDSFKEDEEALRPTLQSDEDLAEMGMVADGVDYRV